MNTNLLNIKTILTSICLLFFSLDGYAGHWEEESSPYKKRVANYQQFWESLIPTYSKIQYAGGMGLINLGVGWSYGKNLQWETDAFLGFLPRYSSDKSKITMTLKQNFIPWRKELNQRLTFEPLTCGLYFNTVFSNEFWTKEPDRYPKGYYGFSTRVRTHILWANVFASTSRTRNASFPEASQPFMKSALATSMWPVHSPTI